MSDDSLPGAMRYRPAANQGLGEAEIARTVAFLASGESGMMTGSLVDFDQTVPGANNAPPPPVADWPRITGVNFG